MVIILVIVIALLEYTAVKETAKSPAVGKEIVSIGLT